MSEQLTYFPPKDESFALGRVGAYLGMSGAIISMLIFTAGCFGYYQVFTLMPYIPLGLGTIGMILSLIAGFCPKDSGLDDTQTFLSIFTSFLAMASGFLLLTLGNHWQIFYTAPTT